MGCERQTRLSTTWPHTREHSASCVSRIRLRIVHRKAACIPHSVCAASKSARRSFHCCPLPLQEERHCCSMRQVESWTVYLSLFVVWHNTLPFTSEAASALLLLLVAHLFLEQPRWQLTLLYALDAYLLHSILFDSDAVWPAGWLFILATSAIIMATAALACLFPVAKFPELTGQCRRANKPTSPSINSSHSQLTDGGSRGALRISLTFSLVVLFCLLQAASALSE